MLTMPSSPLMVADCIIDPRLSIALSNVSSLKVGFASLGSKMPAIPVNVYRSSLAVVEYHDMLDGLLIRLRILTIDTGRYGSSEMRRIFDEESKLQTW